MWLRRLLALAVVIAGLGCDDPLGPEDVVGTYVLRTVREQPLPVIVMENENVTARLLADTIRLRRNGTGTEVAVYELTGTVTNPSNRIEREIEFEVRDGRLDGGYVCEGFCLAVFQPIRGEFTGEGLSLEVWQHGEGPIDFERVE